jgi:hypothetical protein
VEVIDFLKLDVEGAELDILEGADFSTLGRIQKVALEFHEHFRPGSKEGVLTYLRKNGFGDIRANTGTGRLGIIRASREADKFEFNNEINKRTVSTASL